MKFIIKKRKAENQIKQIAKEKDEFMKIKNESELIDRVRKEEEMKKLQDEEQKIDDASLTSSLHTCSSISDEE